MTLKLGRDAQEALLEQIAYKGKSPVVANQSGDFAGSKDVPFGDKPQRRRERNRQPQLLHIAHQAGHRSVRRQIKPQRAIPSQSGFAVDPGNIVNRVVIIRR